MEIDDKGNSVPSQTGSRYPMDSNIFSCWGSGKSAGQSITSCLVHEVPVWDTMLPSASSFPFSQANIPYSESFTAHSPRSLDSVFRAPIMLGGYGLSVASTLSSRKTDLFDSPMSPGNSGWHIERNIKALLAPSVPLSLPPQFTIHQY